MTTKTKKYLKSTGAILAGLVTIFVTHTGTDAIMHATGIFPPISDQRGAPMTDSLFGLAFAYRFVFSILGCYVTARLAPDKPMKHAIILGVIGVVLSTLGAAVMWEYGTHWYTIGLILISIPCAWLGGKLYEKTKK